MRIGARDLSVQAKALGAALREATAALHSQAERTGIVAELLAGRGSRMAYALLLRNLEPAYVALECGLQRHRLAPAFGGLAVQAVYRAGAIAADLEALAGPRWRSALPLLDAGRAYATRVNAAAEGAGVRLVAHAYVRYLGDLNGGRILRRVLGRTLALGPDALRFHDFAPADPAALAADYRAAIDAAGRVMGDDGTIVAEAVEAFRLNVAISEAVAADG